MRSRPRRWLRSRPKRSAEANVDLHFNMAIMQWLADHRTPLLTAIFSFATFMGDAKGYILIVLGVYVMWDKALGMRLAAVVLLAMSLNHVLKTIIANPRPFIREGTWAQNWAVSPRTALSLASEYSTPSGHAMASGAFYAYVAALFR